MNKWYLLIVFFTACVLGGYYYTQYDFRNAVGGREPDFKMSGEDLFQAFDQDEAAANDKYLGKLIAIKGLVTSFSQSNDEATVSLETGDPMSNIVCELNLDLAPEELSVKVGDPMTIKGEISGKLIDIIVINSVIIN